MSRKTEETQAAEGLGTGTERSNITITSVLKHAAHDRIRKGGFTGLSDYIQHLVRADCGLLERKETAA